MSEEYEISDEILADAFRRLLKHLQERNDVQNIFLMNKAGFCRNCLSTWIKDASASRGTDVEFEGIREFVYGMPYSEWKKLFQTEATPAELEENRRAHSH